MSVAERLAFYRITLGGPYSALNTFLSTSGSVSGHRRLSATFRSQGLSYLHDRAAQDRRGHRLVGGTLLVRRGRLLSGYPIVSLCSP